MNYRAFPLFQDLPETELAEFVAACREETLAAGEAFIEAGTSSDTLYFVLAGTLEVFQELDGEDVQLAVLEAPAVVGEMEALTGDPRAASVRPLEETRALVLPCATLRERYLQGDRPTLKVFLHITRVLARRLHAMNKKFVELQNEDTVPQVHDLQRFQQKLFAEWSF
ncbi:MAG: cyclic nucleotide-binding domain-containing protein [Acidobacteriota bacterium]